MSRLLFARLIFAMMNRKQEGQPHATGSAAHDALTPKPRLVGDRRDQEERELTMLARRVFLKDAASALAVAASSGAISVCALDAQQVPNSSGTAPAKLKAPAGA